MAQPDRTRSDTLDEQAVGELCVRHLRDALPGLDASELDLLSGEVRIKTRRAAAREGMIDLEGLVGRIAARTAAGYRRRRTIWESVLLPWVDEAVDGTLPSTISTGALGHLVDRAWFMAHEVLAGGRAGSSARMIGMRVEGTTWAAAAAGAGLSPEDVTARWRRLCRDRLASAARRFDGLYLYWKWFEEDAPGGRPKTEHTWTRRRLAAFVARLLDEGEERRFQTHLDGCGSCWFALGAISEDPRPDEAGGGHIPASVLARWEQAGDDLVGLERALVRRHLERCGVCREDLRHLGYEPALVIAAGDDREVDLSGPEGADEEEDGALMWPASAPAPAAGSSPPSAAAPRPREDIDRAPRPSPAAAGPAQARGTRKSPLAFLSAGSGAGASRRSPWSVGSGGARAPRGNLGRFTNAWNRLREYMVGGPAALAPGAEGEFLALQGEIARLLPIFPDKFRSASLHELAVLASRRARDLLVDIPTLRSMNARLEQNREDLDRIWHEVFLILAELAGRGR